MKVILSRKGFDSSTGRYPSPHLVDNGHLISFPIPEENDKNEIITGRTYEDLRFDDKLSYLDIMKQLGVRISYGKYVHLDPDIDCSISQDRKDGWRGLFGQSNGAQSHLRNQGVSAGDLFLFFGWFRDVIKTSSGYKYLSGTDRHIIWGYLQVGEIQKIHEAKRYEAWKEAHPHYYYRNRKNNTGYIASKTLSFLPNLSGYGLFKYKDSLVLTCPGQNNRSVWKFPKYFHPANGTKFSHHSKLYNRSNKPVWELYDSHCILNSVGRGQEFVVDGSNAVIEWAKKLFT